MKHTQNETLSEHLLNVDEAFLSKAYDVDDEQKLRAYIKAKKAENRKPFFRTPAFRAAIAAAACVVLAVGVLLTVPPKSGPIAGAPPHSVEPTVESPLPWQQTRKEPVAIQSLDMLNYYTAMKVFADSTKMATQASDSKIAQLSGGAQSGGKKYYYQLDPKDTFSVSKVVFFQIEIKNQKGFLASKIGTGIADVVITENSLEPMITFKNGDRYYSCCQNGGNREGKTYSSHKYIEGMAIVKNLEQENYAFTVVYENFNQDYENVTAKKFTCASFGSNGGGKADGVLPIVGETYVSDQEITLTVGELEKYLNADREKAKETLQKVLNKEQNFTFKNPYFDTVTEENLEKFGFATEYSAKEVFCPSVYTYVDFDSDGVEELLVADGGLRYFLILRCDNGNVAGYLLENLRTLYVKSDGSFLVFRSDGYEAVTRVQFDGLNCNQVTLACKNDGEKLYEVNGTPTTRAKVENYIGDWKGGSTKLTWIKW